LLVPPRHNFSSYAFAHFSRFSLLLSLSDVLFTPLFPPYVRWPLLCFCIKTESERCPVFPFLRILMDFFFRPFPAARSRLSILALYDSRLLPTARFIFSLRTATEPSSLFLPFCFGCPQREGRLCKYLFAPFQIWRRIGTHPWPR